MVLSFSWYAVFCLYNRGTEWLTYPAQLLQVIIIGSMFMCGYVSMTWVPDLRFVLTGCLASFFSTFSITSNSRMMYAFARDGGIPGHTFFNKVDSKWRSPIRTGKFSALCPCLVYNSYICNLLMNCLCYLIQYGWLARSASCLDFLVWEVQLRSLRLPPSPLSVFTSLMVRTEIPSFQCLPIPTYYSLLPRPSLCSLHYHIPMSHSSGIPIALRVIHSKHFVRGPFHLGVMSFPVSITAVVWIAFISIVFILPELNPVDSQTLNYAIVAVGIVITYSMGFWVLSARKWFTGPVKQIEGASLSVPRRIEMEN